MRISLRFTVVLSAIALMASLAEPARDAGWVSLAASADGHKDDGDGGKRKGTVWVVNRDQGSLMIFDARTGAQLLDAPLPVGRGAHDICISERAGKAYITAETDHAVTAVDIETLATESIPVFPLPHHVEPSPDGRLIYVTLASHTPTSGAPAYAIIDTSDHSVRYVTTSDNAAARAHAVFPTQNGRKVYVAHDVGNEVSGVRTATEQIFFSTASTLDPPQSISRAEEVVATKSGKRLWVAARGDGSVKRVDLRFPNAIRSVPVGVQPESVMLTPSEETLVVSSRGTPAALAFVDTAAAALVGTVQIGDSATFGDLAVMSQDGRYVYATFDRNTGGSGGVAVVDVRTRRLVASWPYPGLGRPHGIWLSRKNRLD